MANQGLTVKSGKILDLSGVNIIGFHTTYNYSFSSILREYTISLKSTSLNINIFITTALNSNGSTYILNLELNHTNLPFIGQTYTIYHCGPITDVQIKIVGVSTAYINGTQTNNFIKPYEKVILTYIDLQTSAESPTVAPSFIKS